MASVCMPQSNYQQQHFNMMLLQHQQQHQQQNHNQQPHHHPSSQFHGKHQQRIAPAAAKVLGNSNLQNIQAMPGSQNYGPMLAKKKYTYANMPYGEQLPSVARRNARERNRVKQVNNGFANLRQHLPQTVVNALSNGGRGAAKKLSKVDTLRIAVEYIRGLQDLLDDANSDGSQVNVNSHLMDECSSEGSNYDNSSIGSPMNDGRLATSNHLNSYHSEASPSPTPSYCESDISIGGAAQYIQPLKLEEEEQFKFEAFHNYDDQPDDEELLDYISSWQEQ